MLEPAKPAFDADTFLASAGLGRKIVNLHDKQTMIAEESLAEMAGTTRSRVRFFMNRFRELGLIDYDGRIWVHRALLNVILHDQFPDDNAVKPVIDGFQSHD